MSDVYARRRFQFPSAVGGGFVCFCVFATAAGAFAVFAASFGFGFRRHCLYLGRDWCCGGMVGVEVEVEGRKSVLDLADIS